ncbi:MAG: hypothetical protein PHV49_06655 [Alistipes sp.]|nr:hypothetical protein [Alistipes sp.]
MRLFKKVCLLLLLGCNVGEVWATTQWKEEDYLLVLSSISFDDPWKRFCEPIRTAFEPEGLKVKFDELLIPTLHTEAQIDSLQQRLLATYPHPPRTVVFIGDPGWIACAPLFRQEWKGVPVVLGFSQEIIPRKIEDLLAKTALTPENSMPIYEFNQGLNVAVVKYPYYVRETLRLMMRLMPKMHKLAFISDNRYISEVLRERIRRICSEEFPSLVLEQLTTEKYSTVDLLQKLASYDDSVGVLYFSWYMHVQNQTNSYLVDNIRKVISGFAQTPVFTLLDLDASLGLMSGGYYVDYPTIGERVVEILRKLLNHVPASEIPVSMEGLAHPYLNCANLQRLHIDPVRYPQDAVLYMAPLSFYERYKAALWSVGVFIFVGFVAMFSLVRIRRRARKYAQRYIRLVDNMPLLYVRKEILHDEYGEVVDAVVASVNRAFEDTFRCKREQVLGKRVRELIKEGYPLDWLISAGIHKEITRISFTHPQSGALCHYDLIPFVSEQSGVELFCVDRSRVAQAEEKLASLQLLNQRIIDSIYEPVCLINREGVFEQVLNHPADHSLFADNESVVGTSIRRFIDTDTEFNEHLSYIRMVIDTRTSYHFLHRIHDREGNEQYCLSVRMLYFDPQCIIAFIQNITEIDYERQKNEHYRQFLNSVLDNIPIPISVKDAVSGQYQLQNKAHIRLFGEKFGHVIGGELPYAVELGKMDLQTLQEGGATRIVSMQQPDRELALLVHKKLVYSPHGQNWLVSSAVDITEVQQGKKILSEINNRYVMVLRSIKLIPYTVDLLNHRVDFDFSYIAPADYTGSSHIVWVDAELLDHIYSEDRCKVQKSIEELTEGKVNKIREEFRIKGYYGYEGWGEAFAMVGARDESGVPTLLVGAYMRINERKQIEQDLIEAKSLFKNIIYNHFSISEIKAKYIIFSEHTTFRS